MKHITVLKTEAVDALNLKNDSVVVDCTYGAGGHAVEILNRLGKDGTYIGIDVDETAFKDQEEKLAQFPATKHLVAGNFCEIAALLEGLGISSVTAILADFGWRSEQFASGGRGFSFNNDSELLMTYGDPEQYVFTAHDIVNSWEEEHIADILFGYADERFSRRIAKAIVQERESGEITSSTQLAHIVESAVPAFVRRQKVHPATKTFQALRIAVNDELRVIESLILNGVPILSPGGRMACITFHSTEDRVVKNLFRTLARDQVAHLVNKKPFVPSPEETKDNPRARSAKLRIIEKI